LSAINLASRPRLWTGVVVALASAAGFALANTSANIAYHGGTNALTVAATRFLAPAAALIVWLRWNRMPLTLPPRDAAIAASLGLLTALYTWALLGSFNAIPFALAVLIFYLFPLIAAVIVAAFGWDRFAWKTAAGIVVALGGLALALDVRGGHLDPYGMALAFFAAAGLAVVAVVSSRVFGKGDARPLTLYMAAAASAVLLTICAVTGDFTLPLTGAAWTGLVASSAFYGFAMIAFYIAVSVIGPVRTSLLCYADAVISAVLGVTILHQSLTPVQLVGIAVVIVALAVTTVWR
jgi:drug/metabolite transporter (DMT)-like permease